VLFPVNATAVTVALGTLARQKADRPAGRPLQLLMSCPINTHLLLRLIACRVAVITLATRKMRRLRALLQMLLSSTADLHLLRCAVSSFQGGGDYFGNEEDEEGAGAAAADDQLSHEVIPFAVLFCVLPAGWRRLLR
jgi:hypothetical protein